MQDPLQQNPLKIEMNFDWVEVPNDGSVCGECEMIIVSEKMWRMVAFIDYEPIESRFKMCQACYTLKNPTGIPDESDGQT